MSLISLLSGSGAAGNNHMVSFNTESRYGIWLKCFSIVASIWVVNIERNSFLDEWQALELQMKVLLLIYHFQLSKSFQFVLLQLFHRIYRSDPIWTVDRLIGTCGFSSLPSAPAVILFKFLSEFLSIWRNLNHFEVLIATQIIRRNLWTGTLTQFMNEFTFTVCHRSP